MIQGIVIQGIVIQGIVIQGIVIQGIVIKAISSIGAQSYTWPKIDECPVIQHQAPRTKN
ncbi:MAG: hypothetical protein OES79_07165 [Planctomycetota bacterium]|nr:hypothetical protein [Planctomycetota bacterium]